MRSRFSSHFLWSQLFEFDLLRNVLRFSKNMKFWDQIQPNNIKTYDKSLWKLIMFVANWSISFNRWYTGAHLLGLFLWNWQILLQWQTDEVFCLVSFEWLPAFDIQFFHFYQWYVGYPLHKYKYVVFSSESLNYLVIKIVRLYHLKKRAVRRLPFTKIYRFNLLFCTMVFSELLHHPNTIHTLSIQNLYWIKVAKVLGLHTIMWITDDDMRSSDEGTIPSYLML